MTLPYTRALHPDDYAELEPHVTRLRDFQRKLATLGVPYRKDHEHRDWEYASLLKVLDDLHATGDIQIHDAGSGGSYFPLALKEYGYRNVSVSDSMAYGSIEQNLIEQCLALGITIPMHAVPVENLTRLGQDLFDVTCCVSTIEHVDAGLFLIALENLINVTKPGGLIYLTSDYFRDLAQANQSPYRAIQHTCFTAALVARLPEMADTPIEFVGGMDTTYRGDFVHNYSFITMVLRRLA